MALETPTLFIDDDITSRRLDQCHRSYMIPQRVSPIHPGYNPLYPQGNSEDEEMTINTSNYSRRQQQQLHNDIPSVAYSFPQPTLLALLLSRILDAVIFTSAIAITAYNYWTGELMNSVQKQPNLLVGAPTSTSSSHRYPYYHQSQQQDNHFIRRRLSSTTLLNEQTQKQRKSSFSDVDTTITNNLMETQKQRTEEWAESLAKPEQQPQQRKEQLKRQQQRSYDKAYANPTLASMNKSKHDSKHRSKSLDIKRHEEVDETFSRVDAKLKSLIQRCQDALKSKADFSADDIDVNDKYLTSSAPSPSPPPMNRYRSI
ncbi:hypothetical protein INT45_012621 [Circinella minor]|uniref:Uncharacterized protein n=1 Tax=Circinella minor TaxID=1195481 RepID=A0A8H7RVQ2_9FUNG|nr:hypothetical protein INT45_012621 [Circinella minor]